MNRMLESLIACVIVGLPFLALEGCATEKGEGSETHFVSCKTDVECVEKDAGNRCVDRMCETVPEGTGGSASGGRSGSGGAAPAESGEAAGAGGQAPEVTPDGGQSDDACRLPAGSTPLPPDYAVTFTFTNETASPIAIMEECYRHFEILGCGDGYAEPLPYSADYAGLPSRSCKRECPDTACDCLRACLLRTTTVTPEVPIVEEWDGTLKNKSDEFGGCGCVDTARPTPGRYRVRVPVYAADAPSGAEPLYSVTADFTLGAEATVNVVVPLDARPDGG